MHSHDDLVSYVCGWVLYVNVTTAATELLSF